MVLFRFNTEYNPVQWFINQVSLERVKNVWNTCDDSKQKLAQILFGYEQLKCQRRAVIEEKMNLTNKQT